MKKSQSGEALIIIVLVMAIALTIGLAVATRSLANIRISATQEESARAFSAAEAGIEEALKIGAGAEVTMGTGPGAVTARVIEEDQGGGTEFDFEGEEFDQGDTQTVWLIEHTTGGELGGYSFPANGIITICWGGDVSREIAVEASFIYQAGGEFRVARGAYDANFGRTTSSNRFDRADDVDGGNCGHLAFAEAINLSSDLGIPPSATLYALRLKLLYNSQSEPLAASGGGENFPSQGKCYISTATAAESTRKVQHCQSHKVPPMAFDYALYSAGNLDKE